jgi:putative DNA-binding protein
MLSASASDRPGLASVEHGFLDDLRGPARTAEERRAAFAAPPRGTIEERWAIYAGGYVVRIAEALENDYPAVRRILGAGPLAGLAARYIATCPPRSFDLGRAGDRLASYLVADPLAQHLPFLPDLARLEWAVREAFVAADAAPLHWADLAGLDPECVADARVRITPGASLVSSEWPIHDLWAARDLPDEEVSIPLAGRPQTVLVLRHGLEVWCRPADTGEVRLFEAARAGSTLTALTDETPAEDTPGLVEHFRALVGEGLFMKEEDRCRFRSRDVC